MKKRLIKIECLGLNKETISRLNEPQLSAVAGGQGVQPTLSCSVEEEDALLQEYPQSCCRDSCKA